MWHQNATGHLVRVLEVTATDVRYELLAPIRSWVPLHEWRGQIPRGGPRYTFVRHGPAPDSAAPNTYAKPDF